MDYTFGGGGVGLYVSDRMSYERRDDLEPDSIECIWVEVLCKKAKNFLIGCVYRPPDSSNYLDKISTTIYRICCQ